MPSPPVPNAIRNCSPGQSVDARAAEVAVTISRARTPTNAPAAVCADVAHADLALHPTRICAGHRRGERLRRQARSHPRNTGMPGKLEGARNARHRRATSPHSRRAARRCVRGRPSRDRPSSKSWRAMLERVQRRMSRRDVFSGCSTDSERSASRSNARSPAHLLNRSRLTSCTRA